MDEHVLDDLMKKFGQDVWNFAYSLTQNRTLSDDISQDVFLQAFKHIDSFRGESTVKTWLLRITRNVSINYRRSAFFRRVWLVNEIDPGRWGQSAEQDFMETEASNEVWRQVFRLRTKQREVIVLHAKYELSLQEIADVLQMPVGTVKSRLFGARKKLSKLLEERIAYEII
ncbi:RNA polymerase sigma factor [Paenibacillus sp. NEAU-GSW1]|uniref:RNA polymerase sigma factor n=1 Tax=Paenibacillus sp. NEAU-GSW1 TaxID=2682486 RepID=UPI0012E302A3|nr:sigma-70 family RNA polymerase sigma factor [Paenibacillus sp. NEAU-GSW1]MUT66883.1 sigma-70 family RNA polymerase sigma factor [Paenibacillus sp. NEAU-GSW1]